MTSASPGYAEMARGTLPHRNGYTNSCVEHQLYPSRVTPSYSSKKRDSMKVTKVFVALAALCVALCAPVTGSEGVADVAADSQTRNLRQESAQFAAPPSETGTKGDSNNPLRRRDQALVSAHRVYDPVSGLACSLVGECVACPQSESDESFCRETGYRQELDCPRPKDPKDAALLTKPEDERETRFKACSPADTARPGVAVVKFEVGTRVQKFYVKRWND
ncbi:unnamed protein product [Phytophthora lilii]|uniref:Unnamed protein product n=1 Tax=Phytophthora lilii TaxID=2077276 RepID=A0A9W6WMC0_9STRA|nr:unnamed protein product [Phytophthora lilii]